MSTDDKALALMVFETWLLNGCSAESLPPLKLRRWVNRELKRPLFPTGKSGRDGGTAG